MNWYIGQKVVCIKDHPVYIGGDALLLGREPIKGDVLTIREIGVCRVSKEVCMAFEEIINSTCVDGEEYGYDPIYFAPIEPKQELYEHTTETLIEELEELQPC